MICGYIYLAFVSGLLATAKCCVPCLLKNDVAIEFQSGLTLDTEVTNSKNQFLGCPHVAMGAPNTYASGIPLLLSLSRLARSKALPNSFCARADEAPRDCLGHTGFSQVFSLVGGQTQPCGTVAGRSMRPTLFSGLCGQGHGPGPPHMQMQCVMLLSVSRLSGV
jgi:hypothetical protein